MKTKAPSLRSPLGHTVGLGSARHGTEHWWQQRVTAIALIALSIYLVVAFFKNVVFGDHQSAFEWLSWPVATTFVILFLIAAFHHAVLGLQVVIEDYIHSEGLKLFSILIVKFTAAACVVFGILSAVVILVWSLIPNAPPPS